jgi:adenylate kinase family enzyme
VQRVLVIGVGGSGKSTLARKLAAALQLPLIHLDAQHWKPGWTPTPADEWRRQVQALVAQSHWVMDGNYGGTLDLRLARADTVVFLDLPRYVSLWRVLKRSLRYWGRSRPDMAPGCPERLSWEFVGWVWNYRTRRRPGILRKLAELEETRVIILTSQREVDHFLEQVNRGA